MTLPPYLQVRGGGLHFEDVALAEVAKRFGTPLYVYSQAALTDSLAAYLTACEGRDTLVCYAVKANSSLAILRHFARMGAGFDIVSGGELQRVLAAGGDARKVLFSGVGKTRTEMRMALDHGIFCFNVESLPELDRLNAVALEAGKRAPVSLRINPDVDAKTHPYISTGLKDNKFGIAFADAMDAYRRAAALPGLEVVGIDCHIGSQLLDDAPLLEALDKLTALVDGLADEGIVLHHLDLGGGIGIRYDDEAVVDIGDYVGRVFARIDAWRALRYAAAPVKVLFEPGRSLVGNAGVMLTRVEYLKPGETRHFAIVDAAMNDLMRPAMYDAWHGVVPVLARTGAALNWEIVGPVCESGDWLAHDRSLVLEEGDLLAFLSAGAYGMTMASNYNTRPRAAEVLIDGDRVHLVRERETIADLLAGERLP